MSSTAVRAVFAHMLGLVLIGWATLAQATPQVASVESPGKVLKVSLLLDGGTARYRVERLGDTVVEDSKLGFALRDGRLDREDNPLKNAPHTATAVTASEWTHAYPRELAAFPLASLKQSKYWPPVARVDNVYGDKNVMCACIPVDAYKDDEVEA